MNTRDENEQALLGMVPTLIELAHAMTRCVPDLSDEDLMRSWEKVHKSPEVPFSRIPEARDAQLLYCRVVDLEVRRRFSGVS